MNRIIRFVFLALSLFFAEISFAQWVSPGKLSKAHQTLEGLNNCTLCHNIGEKITKEKCLTCHSKVKLEIEQQRGYHSLYRDQTCTECHQEHRGVDYPLTIIDEKEFDHAKLGFALEGEHKNRECTDCHKTPGTYSGLDKNCLSCHEDTYHGRLDEDCTKCHSFDAFRPSTFKHKDDEIGGRHQTVECLSCHVDGHFKELDQNCASCHKDEHKGQLSQKCEDCHQTTDFKELKFDHNKQAAFKIEKQHTKPACDECHANQIYERTSTSCNACHADEHKGETDEDCSKCHVQDGFDQVTFKHEKPFYVLQGAHQQLDCQSCHPNDNFRETPQTCTRCHKDGHKGELDQKCETCHTFDAFAPSTFKHEKPNYELTGIHKDMDCSACHVHDQFSPLDKNCIACHEEEHKGQLSTKCEDCHTTDQFKTVTFKHKEIDFQTKGKHGQTSCHDCHDVGLFEQNNDCVTCHTDVHQQKLGGDCTKCHGFDSWGQIVYDHNLSDFILKGRHNDVSCEECHQHGVFEGTRSNCYDCHLDPHDKKFGLDCQECHSEDGWLLVNYNHDFTGFSLQGMHAQEECASCHPQDRLVGTPNTCYGCHRSDYEAAIEPNHRAAKFGNDCEECHKNSDLSWEFGVWQEHESIFPLRISSAGHHDNFTCSECHPTANNYKKYNCLACHDRGDMDQAHKNTRQYRYQNSKCLKCHPMGEIEEDF